MSVFVFAVAALVKQAGTFKGDLLPAVRNQGASEYQIDPHRSYSLQL
jgi:hypothetical protein